ncbi:MAG: PTS sugar transporter subunit IIA [Spirochaetaceae bacterium]|jgi:PTS system fructose-specific IIC component/PTS system nitrogen regulatory IIA component|nr:PTS sugar transporter subunit IIA [Spirochaetaceae bacterium]
MFLSDVFLPEFIIMDLESEDKDEVFEEMVSHFCTITKSGKREEILASLHERESKMSTGVHAGIAIPHGKTSAVDRSYGVMGISRKGIDYDALDGQPVYLVFMELAPPVEAEKHLHLLRRIAELLRNPQFYDDCIAAKGKKDVYEVLKKYEDIDE